ncbi:hypothetical protein O0235_02770 [Tepidiforma flava]|uniref:Uncharacterized protein n=1 Tax=Tepidiforma flava TaxID=3004094 RepID=A0ABY7M7I9_9CHLR|nr:hypothetical protein [Tepidiforma flava]WBL36501.1 hypothetical protein O0235_02770 [Tepidiforma flava]
MAVFPGVDGDGVVRLGGMAFVEGAEEGGGPGLVDVFDEDAVGVAVGGLGADAEGAGAAELEAGLNMMRQGMPRSWRETSSAR